MAGGGGAGLLERLGGSAYGRPAIALVPAVFGGLGRAVGRWLQRRREGVEGSVPGVEFAGLVAHDFRDPLAALLAQVGALRRRARDDSVSVKTADLLRLERLGWRLDRLVGDLFDSMVVANSQVRLLCEPVELTRAVPALLERLSPMLAGHRVSFEVQGEPPAVLADRGRVDQVLANLLENAAKFSPEGSLIEVGLRRAKGGALVTVRDHGVGIAPAELGRLFDRSYQARRTRTKKSGLGLGLYLTKGLVEAHGGRLRVESKPGNGSLFSVFLPAARLRAAAPGMP